MQQPWRNHTKACHSNKNREKRNTDKYMKQKTGSTRQRTDVRGRYFFLPRVANAFVIYIKRRIDWRTAVEASTNSYMILTNAQKQPLVLWLDMFDAKIPFGQQISFANVFVDITIQPDPARRVIVWLHELLQWCFVAPRRRGSQF